jgi:serine O-acetyltransferase
MNFLKIHNFGRWFYKRKIRIIPGICKRMTFFLFNCDIPISVEFKKGTYLYKGGMGVIIHGHSTIGEYVAIGSHVTIGGNYGAGGVPHFGNEILIAPGAAILGNVKVGNNCIIGANAVVMKDVPDNTVVGGIPAKELKKLDPGFVKSAYFAGK